METIKVNPWSADQGDFVVINAADFDPLLHTAFDAQPKKQAATPKNALKDLGGNSGIGG